MRQINLCGDKQEIGRVAARQAAHLLESAIAAKGSAVFVAATGASQFEFLDALARETAIDWSRTTLFHLDEYVGLPSSHRASFRRYLRERLIDRVHPGSVHLIEGDAASPQQECGRLNALISQVTVDVAFVGIGENGHLAFNDPPADFRTDVPYAVVDLDERCRRQQVGEGWFAGLGEIPRQAISMSIRQIMKARSVICVVPDARKSDAVAHCLEGEISVDWPASILRMHPDVYYYLDKPSATGLTSEATLAQSAPRIEAEWRS